MQSKNSVWHRLLSAFLALVIVLGLIPTSVFPAHAASNFSSDLENELNSSGGKMTVNVRILSTAASAATISSDKNKALATWLGEYTTPGGLKGLCYCADHRLAATSKGTMKVTVTGASKSTDPMLVNTYYLGNTDELRDQSYFVNSIWPLVTARWPEIKTLCSDADMKNLSEDEWQKATQMAIWMSLKIPGTNSPMLYVDHQAIVSGGVWTAESSAGAYDHVRWSSLNSVAKKRICTTALALHYRASLLADSGQNLSERIPGAVVRDIDHEALGQYAITPADLDFTSAGPDGTGNIAMAYEADPDNGIFITNYYGVDYYTTYWAFISKTQPQGNAVITVEGSNVPEGTKVGPLWSFEPTDVAQMAKIGITPENSPQMFYDSTSIDTSLALYQRNMLEPGKGDVTEADMNAAQGGYAFGTYFKVLIPVDSVTPDSSANIVLKLENPQVLSYSCFVGSNTNSKYQPFVFGTVHGSLSSTGSISWNFSTNSEGEFSIYKKDAGGKLLDGIEFTAKNNTTGTELKAVTKNGIATFKVPEKDMGPAGNPYTWTITETPSAGYQAIPSFEMKPGDAPKVVVNNKITTKPPEGVVQKIDAATGEGLAGAVINFRGLDESNAGVDADFVTEYGGTVNIQWWDPSGEDYLPPGHYEVREKTPPKGYNLDDEDVRSLELVWDEILQEASHTGPIIFQDSKKPYITIEKYDQTTGLEGVKFNVFKDGRLIDTTEGTLNGKVEYYGPDGTGLENGYYEFQEVAAPDPDENGGKHYLYSDQKQGIMVDVDTENPVLHIGTLHFENTESPVIRIFKKSTFDGAPLKDAVFEVSIDGRSLGTFSTDEDGYINISKDVYGEYLGDETRDSWTVTVTEVTPPPGYTLPKEPTQQAEITRGTTILPFQFEDAPYPNLQILKVDAADENKALPGAIFDIFIDGVKLFTKTTDNEGKISISYDEFGKFLDENEGQDSWQITVTEKTPPPGYLLPPAEERSQTQTLKKGETLKEFVFKDYQYPYIEILKLDSETKEPLAGTAFRVEIDGHEISGPFVSDENGIVRIDYDQYKEFLGDISDPDKTWTITVTEINATENYNRDRVDVNGWKESKPLTLGMSKVSFEFADTHYRDIWVTKSDADNGWKLGGAKYKLHCVSLEDPELEIPADRFATTEAGTGIAKFENVPNGVYEITEVEAPYGYQGTDKVFRVEVTSESERVIDVPVTNEPLTGLTIRKIDSVSKQGVAGAKFTITGYTNDGQYVDFGEKITDANGVITLEGIEPGQYTLTEIAVPDGYVLDSTPRVIKVDEQHQSTYYEFANKPTNSLYVLKLDSATGLPVPGVRFAVYTAGGTHVADIETGENGYARLTDLLPGGYVVKEIWCPPDMILDPTVQTFEVKDDDEGKIYELIFYNNEKTTLLLQKIDKDTRQPLEGAYFTIRSGDGTEIAVEQRTDENGLIILKNLDPGVYIVEEIRAPEGYVLEGGERRIVLEANKTKNVVIENTKKGGLAIQKVDADTGAVLPGASFEVYSVDDRLLGTYSDLDMDGYIYVSDLEPGSYFIKEIKAPDGYILNSSMIKVQVNDAEMTQVRVENSSTSMLTISKIDADTNKPLAGAEFTISTLEGQVVKTGITDESGKLVITGLNPGWYNVTEVKAPNGYVLNDSPKMIQIIEGKDSTVEIENTAKNGLWLEKLDAETMTPLAGAVFEVYTMEDVFVGKYTTDTSGTINTTELAPGHYKIKEVKAPDGYLLDDEWKHFEMIEGETTHVTFKDWKRTVIRIEKYDAVTGDPLAGAVFEVRTADGKTVIGTYTTDVSGSTYSLPVDPGAYVVEEISAPDGYVLNTEIKPVNVEAGHMPEVVRFYNQPEETTIVKKVDSETKQPLAGATFRLFDQEGDAIGEYTTNSDGIVLLPALAPGTYSIQEVAAPDGYMIDNACKMTFEVKPGQHASLTFTDTKKPGIQILKVDDKTGDPLAGATFEIFNQRGQRIYTQTTDEAGMLIFPNLDPGVYFVRETKAPDGYTLTNESETVVLDAGDSVILTFTNTKDSGLNIKKTDPDGKPLAGAVFTITRNSDGKVLGRYTTDATGCLAVEGLEPGDYTVTEIIAPEGYVMSEESKVVTVSKGEPSYVSFVNEKKTVIEITKVDSQTGDPLEGAVFDVETTSGELLGTYTTGKNGIAFTDVMDPGTYVVREKVAPDGYALPDLPARSVALKTGSVAKITFEDVAYGQLVISKVDADTNEPLAGAKFKVLGGNAFMQTIGEYTTDSNGQVILNDLKPGNYMVYETSAPAGYSIVGTGLQLVNLQSGMNEVTVTNKKAPGLTIVKVDAVTKDPLPGAEFEVKSCKGKVVFTGQTDEFGQLLVPSLEAGCYIVTETKAPNGYSLSAEAQNVSMDGVNATTLTFEDQPLATLTIKKVSALSSEPLAGASFEVRSMDGSIVKSVTTDATGLAFVSGLTEGAYQITETQAPEGYVLTGDHKDFYVSAGKDNVLTVENYMNAGLVIRKVDKGTGELLQGAKFSVEASDGSIAYTGTTDASGIIMTGPLDPGTYVVREVSAPNGYLLDSEPQVVELKLNEVRTVEFADSPLTSLLIEKVDSLTKETLAGARFKITRVEDNKVITEGVTGTDGLCLVSDLEPGKYLVEEVVAPEGYIMETDPIIADVVLGKVAHVTFFNAPMTGIIIDSIDQDSKQPLSGSTFEIWIQNGDKVCDLTTDSTGRVQTPSLEPGFYVIKQTVVKDGYTIVTGEQVVEVKSGDQPVYVTFYAKPGYTLRIENVNDKDADVTISKSEFTVEQIDGTIIGTYITDVNGQILIPGLKAGWYIVTNTRPGDGYVLNEKEFRVEVKAGTIATVVVRSVPLTGLTIDVLDYDTKSPLEGAIFQVYVQNGQLVNSFTSDTTGHIETGIMNEGYYVIKQMKAPDGYLVAEDQTIHLTTNSPSNATFLNQKTKNLTIVCNDSNGNPLSGYTVEVRMQNGDVVGTFVTDASGHIEVGSLNPGYYVIKQIKAPDGFVLDASEKTFYLSTESSVTIRFESASKQNIMISCVDAATNQALAGAQFTVTKQNGGLIGTYTTDEAGMAETELLNSGYYVIRQVKASDGYINENFEQTIYVGTEEPARIIVQNKSMSNIVIRYEDALTGAGVSGATFDVSEQNGKYVGTFTTEAGGNVSTISLTSGYYVVKLKSAPAGYGFVADEQTVFVSEGSPTTVIFKGTSTSSLMILAMSDSNKPLANATFKVLNMDGSEVGEYTTDVSGSVSIMDLNAGFYRVYQTGAPSGYETAEGEQLVQVKAGSVASITFVSKAHTGAVIYTTATDGSPVIGVRFEIREQNGNAIGTYLSDSTGMVNVPAMKPGFYEISILGVPDGFSIAEKTQTIEVKTGSEVRLTFDLVSQGTVKIHLTDADTGAALAGAKFKITELGGNLIGEYTTDNTGYAVSGSLNPGYYVVTQIGAANGYTFEEQSKNVEVKSGSATAVEFVNARYSAIILKNLNKADDTPLGGAKFTLTTIDGTVISDAIEVGHDGTTNLPQLEAGYYVLTQTKAPDGFSLNAEKLQLKVGTGEPTVVTFYNQAQATLHVLSVDKDGNGISGMKVKITRLDQSLVGEYMTDSTGRVIVNNVEPGWYVISEVAAPDGYVASSETQTIEVKANTVTQATFTHNKVAGLQILTTVSQTNKPLVGATYTIEKLNGERVGTYTSNEQGLIYVNLSPDTYVVKQTALPDGYTVDSAPRNVTVGTDSTTQLTYSVGQLSSMRILITDSATGNGIYGMRFLLKTVGGEIIGEYTTNDQGYIVLDRSLTDGYYTLELIYAPDGYTVDHTPRTIQILNGETTEVKWTFSAEAGQIQVVVRSSAYNNMLDLPMDSLLSGATFEIYNPDTYAVVDTIVSGTDGVAASSPLPIGRYIIRQKSAAPYFNSSDKEMEVKLKVANDVVRVEYYNQPSVISLSHTIKSNANVSAGSFMRVDFPTLNNASDTRFDDFYWHIKIPTDCARAGTLYTGSWDTRAWYTVSYKTNMHDYRQMGANLLSSNQNNLDLSSTALGLQSGEYVTDIRVNFGIVSSSFKTVTPPALYLYVMPNVYNGYKCIIRSEIGGKIGTEWQTATATWTTNVLKSTTLPGKLPTTGF